MRTTEQLIEQVKENYEFRVSKIRNAIEGGNDIDRQLFGLERKEDETLLKALMFEHVHTKQALNKEKLIDSKRNNIENDV